MGVRSAVLAVVLPFHPAAATSPNHECVASVGLPRVESTPWAATVRLLVSNKGDASRIDFTKGAGYAGLVPYQSLPGC